jgi:hypothetical protein
MLGTVAREVARVSPRADLDESAKSDTDVGERSETPPSRARETDAASSRRGPHRDSGPQVQWA